jgi:hypothetical protein
MRPFKKKKKSTNDSEGNSKNFSLSPPKGGHLIQ